MQLKNDRFLKALLKQPVDRTPVWLMRQAGRYLPEYCATRQQAGDFLTLCKTPELACEVTLQPLARFPLDAAILFSDILTIPDAMGLGLYFAEGEGPRFERPIRNARDVAQLMTPDPEDQLRYVMDAVRLIHQTLDGRVPLIGFAGSPWTLATYMVEGKGGTAYQIIKTMLYDEPVLMHALLQHVTNVVAEYLNAQIAAGAQALMIFDTWGGVLTQGDYRQFSLHYMTEIVQRLQTAPDGSKVPVILFTKGGGQWLQDIANSGCQGVGLDWTVDLSLARQQIGDRVALQGNMDPCLLYAKPERIEQEVQRILSDYGQGSGHIFNLGHGIHPAINPEHVAVMVDAVHRLSASFH